MRVWENKLPLTPTQLQQVYFRYHTNPLNQLSAGVESLILTQRTPFFERSTSEQVQHLKEIKRVYSSFSKNDFDRYIY